MTDILDFWAQEDFEDTVASALIAMYERKLLKNKGAGPNALKEKRLASFRQRGAYMPSNERFFMGTNEGLGFMDIDNDRPPAKGIVSLGAKWGNYFNAVAVERVHTLPKRWRQEVKGLLYEITNIQAENNGLAGERYFVSLCENGLVHLCDEIVQFKQDYNYFGNSVVSRLSNEDKETLRAHKSFAGFALQALADRRFCWQIQAREHKAKISLGCMKEEIKSLLYARSLPMTETGRKRPVLHLVEAHKRRMKNGTEIDITPFLRGSQEIEMGGTLFKVKPPTFVKPELSKNSQRYYA